MSVAINRLTAAGVVLQAHEAGEFWKISAREALRLGWDIAADEAFFFEWPDGFALGDIATGQIEVLIPSGTYVDVFFLNPATGEIKAA